MIECNRCGVAFERRVPGRRCDDCRRKLKLESNARVKAKDPEADRIRRAAYVRAHKLRHPERVKQQARAQVLRDKYGLTPEEYQTLAEKQGNLCALCGQPETARAPKTGKIKDLAVDHDHVTGRVRGLLCGKCNQGLGLFGDSTEGLYRALMYLEGS